MKVKNLKALLIAFAVFLVATMILCYPNLKGLELKGSDYESWMSASKKADTYFKAHDKKGEVSWTTYMFGGMPTYLMYGGESPSTLTNLQGKMYSTVSRQPFLILLCMISFFAFAKSMRWNNIVSIIGSIAFAFSSYNIIIAIVGHDGKLFCIAYSIGALAGMVYFFNGNKWLGGFLFALFSALDISSAHYQIIFYFLIIACTYGAYLFWNAIKAGKLKPFFLNIAMLLGLGILAALPAMKSMLQTKAYLKVSIREQQPLVMDSTKQNIPKKAGLDQDYAFQWSNGIMESFSVLLPRIQGGSSGEKYQSGKVKDFLSGIGVPEDNIDNITTQLPLYYGNQPFLLGSVYFGAIIIFFFVLGMFIIPSRLKWWFLGVTILGFMMSWGKNFSIFNDLLFNYFPMYNRFRTPSMSLVIPQIVMCIVGVWGISETFNKEENKENLWKFVKYALFITGGICVVFGLLGSMFMNFHNPEDAKLVEQYTQMFGGDANRAQQMMSAILSDRSSANMWDALRSLAFIVAAVALVWAYINKKLKTNFALIGIGILICIDLISFDFRYLNDKLYVEKTEGEYAIPARAVDTQILQDKDPYYRVMDFTRNPFNDAYGCFYHNMVGGYHPAKLRIYQDLIENQISKNNTAVYNMLNTKYFIAPGPNKTGEQVFPNPTACGNAWFVDKIELLPTPQAEMKALNAPTLGDTTKVANAFNPNSIALVQEAFKKNITKTVFTKGADAVIKLTKYDMQQLDFESNNTNDGFAVFSDVYYDESWHAYIDNVEAPIVKTDYAIRGLVVPAGKHQISFRVESKIGQTGQKISSIGNIALLLFLLLSLVMYFKQPEVDEIKVENI